MRGTKLTDGPQCDTGDTCWIECVLTDFQVDVNRRIKVGRKCARCRRDSKSFVVMLSFLPVSCLLEFLRDLNPENISSFVGNIKVNIGIFLLTNHAV